MELLFHHRHFMATLFVYQLHISPRLFLAFDRRHSSLITSKEKIEHLLILFLFLFLQESIDSFLFQQNDKIEK